MYVLQPSLYPFESFIQMDRDERLLLVLDALNAEPLIAQLEQSRKGRRNEYPVRVMWYTLVAGIVYRLRTITDLVAELERNPGLRYLCGIRRQRDVPKPWTYSRFLTKLVEHEAYLDQMVHEMVDELAEGLPDFGRTVAVDATDIRAYSNAFCQEPSDPDARWGVKTKRHTGVKKANARYCWLGYKLHLMVDATYELPIQWHVTPANVNETTQLVLQGEEVAQQHPEVAERVEYIAADAGYDSQKNCTFIYQQLKAKPVIPLNLGNEKEPPGICNAQGTPLCLANREMSYAGYDNGYLKYRAPCIVQGFACPLGVHGRCCHPDGYGTVVKLNVKENPRRYPPLPRETKKWKRVYNKRSSVERVNSRLKEHLLIDDLRVRGIKKVRVRTGLSILVMMAGAVAMLRKDRVDKLRSIARLAA